MGKRGGDGNVVSNALIPAVALFEFNAWILFVKLEQYKIDHKSDYNLWELIWNVPVAKKCEYWIEVQELVDCSGLNPILMN